MPDTETVVVRVNRFGLTVEMWHRYHTEHAGRVQNGDKAREPDGMAFYDWEAAALRRVFERFSNDPEVCGVLVAMMEFFNVKDGIAGR